jgi:DNA-binding XRE family transcriptional regulator
MKQAIRSVADLGLVLRAVRKSSSVRQDDLAATVGVSKQFAADVERGKPTVQLGLVLKLLQEMGILLSADIPDSVAPVLHKLQAKQRSDPSGR